MTRAQDDPPLSSSSLRLAGFAPLPQGLSSEAEQKTSTLNKKTACLLHWEKEKKEEKSRSCVATSLRHLSPCLLRLHHRQYFLNRMVNVTLQVGNCRSTAFKNKHFAVLQRDAMVILSPTC